MTSIMLNLETLGCGHDAAIATVGACTFDLEGHIRDTFYEVVDLTKSKSPGVVDASTIYWWLTQQRGAQLDLVTGGNALGEVLRRFTFWVGTVKGKFLWSNGPTFDERILRDAYDRYEMRCPIAFRNSRCCRTIFAQAKKSERLEREGTHHNALDDAVYQAKCIAQICRDRGLTL